MTSTDAAIEAPMCTPRGHHTDPPLY